MLSLAFSVVIDGCMMSTLKSCPSIWEINQQHLAQKFLLVDNAEISTVFTF
jgi:hypothetical protein